jgi:GntR family transcriptional regulator of vanillate catabolism
VISRLRDLLLDGALAPDTHLHEAALAKSVGVSRTPVRDALRVLANEGLLIYSANKGYVVKRFDVEDIFGAYDVRGVLEAMACRIAAERGLTAEVEASLRKILEQSALTVNGDNWELQGKFEWPKLNMAFHYEIIDFSGNQHLMHVARQMRRLPKLHDARLQPDHTVFQSVYSQARARRSHEEHCDLFQAIIDRQGSRAEALMREHVYRNREALRRSIAPPLAEAPAPSGARTNQAPEKAPRRAKAAGSTASKREPAETPTRAMVTPGAQ